MAGADIFCGLVSSDFIQILGHGKDVKKMVGVAEMWWCNLIQQTAVLW